MLAIPRIGIGVGKLIPVSPIPPIPVSVSLQTLVHRYDAGSSCLLRLPAGAPFAGIAAREAAFSPDDGSCEFPSTDFFPSSESII